MVGVDATPSPRSRLLCQRSLTAVEDPKKGSMCCTSWCQTAGPTAFWAQPSKVSKNSSVATPDRGVGLCQFRALHSGCGDEEGTGRRLPAV
eukprot:2197125-Rhodomonas_salina.3